MKTLKRKLKWSFAGLLAVTLFVTVAMAEPRSDAGLIVHAWYQSYCDPPTPGVPPYCVPPSPYSGSFSIFTSAGQYVASASTGLLATFTLSLTPGRYEIVPDDPLLAEAATTVIVRGHRFTEILIWLPPL
jgi:hypothetical protein